MAPLVQPVVSFLVQIPLLVGASVACVGFKVGDAVGGFEGDTVGSGCGVLCKGYRESQVIWSIP